MKKIIAILILALVLTSCENRSSAGRYRLSQTYAFIDGVTTMNTTVAAWPRGGMFGSVIYDNTITLNGDSVVYYMEVEKLKAETYRIQWFKINRPDVEPRNVDE